MSAMAMPPLQDSKGPLLKGVKFRLHASLAETTAERLKIILLHLAAEEAPSTAQWTDENPELTHIISDTIDFPQASSIAATDVALVTPFWVTRSYDLGLKQEARFYSPDPRYVLSGLCICTSELPPWDDAAIANMVASLGGQFRKGLTREVTHLIVKTTQGQKYQQAITNGRKIGMQVVLPHWLFDVFEARTLVREDYYAFPDPPLLRNYDSNSETLPEQSRGATSAAAKEVPTTLTHVVLGEDANSASLETYSKTSYESSAEKAVSVLAEKDGNVAGTKKPLAKSNSTGNVSEPQIFAGQKVYICSTLKVHSNLAGALQKRILGAGAKKCFIAGTSEDQDEDDGDAAVWERELLASDIVVGYERSGWEYWKSTMSDTKTIGNLPWLLYVLSQGKLDSPQDRLLHYPPPQYKATKMEGQKFTISNYTGPARDLIKTMIELMGGTVAGSMDKTTTCVIAASLTGKKVSSAQTWGIPILNHHWIEECFKKWTYIAPNASAAYSIMTPGVEQMSTIGQARYDSHSIKQWKEEDAAKKDKMVSFRQLNTAKQRKEAGKPPTDMDLDDHGIPDIPMRESGDENDEMDVQASLEPEPSTSKSTPGRIAAALIPESNKSTDAVVIRPAEDSAIDAEATKSFETPAPKVKPKKVKKPPAERRQSSTSAPESNRSNRSAPPPDTDADLSLSGYPRRKAATAASDKVKLNAEDMNVFEKEKRQSNKRLLDAVEAQMDASSSTKKKSRASSEKGKARATPDEDEEMLSEDSAAGSKAQKRSTKDRKKAESMPNKLVRLPPPVGQDSTRGPSQDDITSFDAPPGAKHHKSSKSSLIASGGVVRIMSTGITIETSQEKQILALGAKFTSDPEEATHVISKGISRTEKFLRALPHAPLFVTDKWLHESINSGELTAEEPYLLNDKAGEMKWNFKFDEALGRARKGKVFDGKTFYLTNKIDPPQDLLKRIITANGGEIAGSPSHRLLSGHPDTHFMISCSKDKSVWKSIVDKDPPVTIYHPELVLASALKQEMVTEGSTIVLN